MTDGIGDRIKKYEKVWDLKLTPRSCLFIRIDGKAFHSFTAGCDKPFDQRLIDTMVGAMVKTADQMMGFKVAYHQSDEVTFMLSDFDTFQTQGWFNYELQKIVSISASLFTAEFNRLWGGDKQALFDSRAFIVPTDDWPNVFIWRQRDWERNSVQMLARAHFSHKQCVDKKLSQLHELLSTKGVNWAELSDQHKNGTTLIEDELTCHKMEYSELKAAVKLSSEDILLNPPTTKKQ